MSTLVQVSAVVSAGLVAGALLGDRVAASQARARLDATGFVTFMQAWHTHFVRFVGPLMLIGLVAGCAWLVLAWSHGSGMQRALIAASIAGLVVVAGLEGDLALHEQGLIGDGGQAEECADGRFSADLASESLRLINLRYQAGESTVLEVVDAQNTLIQERNAYDEVQVRFRVAVTSLQSVTGGF